MPPNGNIVGLLANIEFDETLISENYLGPMTEICDHCEAKHFCFEYTVDKKFSNCCHKGKIYLPKNPDYPRELKLLATGQSKDSIEFRKNIRSYNNALAFASFGANFDKLSGKGPQVIRICGQIYHNVYALHPNENEARKYGQLYVLDNEMATAERKIDKSNYNTKLELLSKLDNLLRKINPYAQAYKMMYEVEQEELKRCSKNNCNPRNVIMSIKRNDKLDKNRYNEAMCNEVAMIFVGEDGQPPIERDIVIYLRHDRPISISPISKHTDPMTYPLIYPNGGYGWMPDMKCKIGNNNISNLQFYSYRLSVRSGFNPYLNLGKISQQAIVDAFVKVESSRLYFIRKNQNTLRSECYKGVMDYLHRKEESENLKIGRMFILPSSFIGSPRCLKQNYIDSMTLVNRYGKPDLFLTMTCNPKWKEIVENLEEYESPIDRLDIVAKVFQQKVKEFKELVIKDGIFGKSIAHTYVIEFQKRGLPHMHMLLFLGKNYKLDTPEKVDNLINAEIPNENLYPNLYSIVKQFMIHGPCGVQNINSPCMDQNIGKCTKNFPKNYINKTTFQATGYPLYKRGNDGRQIKYKN